MPTDANTVIDSFTGQYRFLSNFYSVVINYDGSAYPTLEHAYQAAKTRNATQQLAIRVCSRPGQAKRIGQRVTLRPDWDRIKLPIMLDLLRQKFRHPLLREMLLATGTSDLVEGNDWGDTFWGMCGGTGQNHLGKLLMQVREELRG